MPAIVVAAAVTAAGGIATGAMMSRASGKSTDAQTRAENYAAEQQAASAAAELAYQKQQADQLQSNYTTTSKANYDQWKAGQVTSNDQLQAREGRLSTLGGYLGSGPRAPITTTIPDWVPPVTTLGSAAGASTTTPSGTGAVTSEDPITAWTQKHAAEIAKKEPGATGDGNTPAYWARRIREEGAFGGQYDENYWTNKLYNGEGGSSATTTKKTVVPGSILSYATPYVPINQTPRLV